MYNSSCKELFFCKGSINFALRGATGIKTQRNKVDSISVKMLKHRFPKIVTHKYHFLSSLCIYYIIKILENQKKILKSRWVIIFQSHAYATLTSQEFTSKFPGVGFFTLVQGISTATYLTLPRLPRRPIGPEPFQYLFNGVQGET